VAVVPDGPFLLDRLRHPPVPAGATARVVAVGGVHDDLPASAREVARLRDLAGSRRVVALDADNATPERVLGELAGAGYAHLATHGFFADVAPADGPRRAAKAGLALAGGRIVTAADIAGCPLTNLRLAVLSGCETGLGQGGAVGLVGAFHRAGCSDVVASLWAVNDDATAALMGAFYRHLWHDGRPPIEALRRAKLEIYRHSERVGGPSGGDRGPPNPRRPRPVETTPEPIEAMATATADTAPAKWWAAFVLSGAGR
jgi:CHAT domain-containing protein